MLLHMLNQSPHNVATSATCLRTMSNGDTLLLLEDGVYHATQQHADKLLQHPHITVVALHTDIAARGLQALVHPAIRVISDDEWVTLTCTAHSICSWN